MTEQTRAIYLLVGVRWDGVEYEPGSHVVPAHVAAALIGSHRARPAEAIDAQIRAEVRDPAPEHRDTPPKAKRGR